jgi:acylphosphatase
MKVRKHVWIEGYVQGVGFRLSTAWKARSLGVTGWVRNLYDGRVEAVFEGEEEAVSAIVEWCHEGPPGALVRKVEVKDEEYRGEFSGFFVRGSG